MSVNQGKDEIEISETNYFRVIFYLAITVFFAIFFITLVVLIPDFIGLFLGLGFLVLCPIGYISSHLYINDLRKKFIMSEEEIKLQKTHKLIKIRWDDFDIIGISAKGEFYVHFSAGSSISREYTKFRLIFINRENNEVVQTWKFRFYKRDKAAEVLRLFKQKARKKNKEITVNAKYMYNIS